MSIPIAQFITPPSSTPRGCLPLVSIYLFSASVSLFLPCKPVHLYHFSRFYIYVLIYDISNTSSCYTPVFCFLAAQGDLSSPPLQCKCWVLTTGPLGKSLHPCFYETLKACDLPAVLYLLPHFYFIIFYFGAQMHLGGGDICSVIHQFWYVHHFHIITSLKLRHL